MRARWRRLYLPWNTKPRGGLRCCGGIESAESIWSYSNLSSTFSECDSELRSSLKDLGGELLELR